MCVHVLGLLFRSIKCSDHTKSIIVLKEKLCCQFLYHLFNFFSEEGWGGGVKARQGLNQTLN